MATKAQAFPPPRRSKQLRLLFVVGAVVALIEGVRSTGYFAVRDNWHALVFMGLKLILLIGLAVGVWRKTQDEIETESNVLALKVGIVAVLMSFLNDEAFLTRW